MHLHLRTGGLAVITPSTMDISSISEAIEDIRKGRMVILVDDEDRENEGDLVIAAEKTTPAAINFMAVHGRGLICLALPGDKVDAIGLGPMTQNNKAPLSTAFTVSVDAATGVKTGVSAADRSHTVQTIMRDDCTLSDLRTPGHTMPLKARKGGVLTRAGQTEGGVDLARLAGLKPGAVICEIMKDDGGMMRLGDLLEFGKAHGIKVVTVEGLISYRLQKESFVHPVAEVDLPTAYGNFRSIAFRNELDTCTHLAMVMGDIHPDEPTLVRVHRSDLVADVFGFVGERKFNRLEASLARIAEEGRGVILYLRTGSNGEMALDSLNAYLARTGQTEQRSSANMNSMGFREFGIGAQILSHLGLKKIRVLTNNPAPFHGLGGFGLEITGWEPFKAPNQDSSSD